MIETYLRAAVAVARELRRSLMGIPAFKAGEWFSFWHDARPVFDRADSLTARLLRDAQLAGWVDVAENIFRRSVIDEAGVPSHDSAISLFDHPRFTDSPVSFADTEAGAEYLYGLRAVTRQQFDQLDNDAKQVAFTVARVARDETVAKVQTVLADAVRTGDTYRQVRPRLREALDTSPLSESQIETIHRTYVGRAQTAGMVDTLLNPMVRDEFPYLMWSATHDSRTEAAHLEMETSGLDGTAIYRADDPIWYWALPPCRWNCRCTAFPISLEDAARYGVREAQEWLRTGRPPAMPTYVKHIPLVPVKGWTPTGGRLLAA